MIRKLYETGPMDVVKKEIANSNLILETKDREHTQRKIDDLEKAGYGRRTNCCRCRRRSRG